MAPTKTARWILRAQTGLDGLVYQESSPIPEVKADEVLVELHAASLNYRDLVVTKGGSGSSIPNVIPSSDGAGIVRAVGSSVTGFEIGDKVCTHLAPFIADDQWPNFGNITAGLGQQVNGTLTEYGVFPQTAIVHMPNNCSFAQAATLTCSALTAWNALFGLQGRQPKKGDWVLTQGTGGVSIAALQFAVAAGANVIASTSSDEKAERLLALGASHVINYRQTPRWGEVAKGMTPGKQGVDIVVDVGGENTLGESMKAVKVNGLVVAAGLVAGTVENEKPALIDTLWNLCIVRGVLLGTRNQFKEMNRFVEVKGIDLAVDEKVFDLKDARRAYERLQQQQHFAKVVIRIR
ncbi:uncharacterized protein PV09_07110 [Verruconis gallopava]|uniref:Enoyl reductase (ER) domain-containing protein n=1 Tax=Verruconis gallopava TaxID=253628 RepID=A0A0D2A3D9_9PEZI|nr:uncharacterized protein PV09_07110 [Verruconis gallopava]KIW01338.1 hypothetical protein PV09_07110 [Verruconis gallopava]